MAVLTRAPENPGETYVKAVEMLRKEPLASYAMVARVLGVGRERVRQIAEQSGAAQVRKKARLNLERKMRSTMKDSK
jgi:hypothetical protein